jgi:1-deoxy-D-xylulose-5-phosphate synthase
MVKPSLEAAEHLAHEGIEAKVVDARFAAPLDEEALRQDGLHAPLIITVEENNPVGGFGEGVAAVLRGGEYDRLRHLTLSLPAEFVGQGSRGELLREIGLDAEGIASSVRRALSACDFLAKGQTGRTA